MPDVCPHEQDIGKIKSILEAIKKEIFGNGNKGVSKDVTILKTEFRELNEKFDDMNDDLKKIATSVSSLAQSRVEYDIVEKAKTESSKQRSIAIQRVGTIFGIAFGMIGALYLILEHLQNH